MGKKWFLTVKTVIGDEAWKKIQDYCAKGDYNGIVVDDQGGEFTKLVEAPEVKA